MANFYDKDGTPLDLMEWGRKLEDNDYKRVGLDITVNNIRISTVWLGLDRSFTEHGRPLIFESIAFDDNDLYTTERSKFAPDLDQERYSTLEEARQGHQRMVAKWTPV